MVNIIKIVASDINGANGIFLILSLFVKSISIQYIDANIKDKNMLPYAMASQKAHSKMIALTFYFE